MKADEYDETTVLNEYLTHNYAVLMTDLERRTYDLAIKREKAKTNKVAADRLREWITAAGADAEKLSLAGPQAVASQFRRRIQRDVRRGKVVINRCPSCSRIVRTPLARQCRWCGYDWHDN